MNRVRQCSRGTGSTSLRQHISAAVRGVLPCLWEEDPSTPSEDGHSRLPVLSIPLLWQIPTQAFACVYQGSSEYTLSGTRSQELNQAPCMKEPPSKPWGLVFYSKNNRGAPAGVSRLWGPVFMWSEGFYIFKDHKVNKEGYVISRVWSAETSMLPTLLFTENTGTPLT